MFVYKVAGGIGFYEVSGWEGARGLFTTRKGGVSPAPYDSFNLGSGGGDDPALVAENRLLLAGALGVGPSALKTVSQVHGNDVYVVHDADEPRPSEGYDALVTNLKGVALGMLTADCVPILLYDPVLKVVGSVHAGWAGTVKGVARRAVEAMTETYGTDPSNVLAAVGPSIGPCCYEVDGAVMGPLKQSLGDWSGLAALGRPGRWQLDLWKTNLRVLRTAGVKFENISLMGLCTACNTDKFYSHRKSGGKTGRMAAVAMLTD